MKQHCAPLQLIVALVAIAVAGCTTPHSQTNVSCIPLEDNILETNEIQVTVNLSFIHKPDFELEVESMPMPNFPRELMCQGISGIAVVDFEIPVAGRPEKIRTVRSSHRQFEQASIEIIKNWRFLAGRIIAPKPISVRGEFRFEFKKKPTMSFDAQHR